MENSKGRFNFRRKNIISQENAAKERKRIVEPKDDSFLAFNLKIKRKMLRREKKQSTETTSDINEQEVVTSESNNIKTTVIQDKKNVVEKIENPIVSVVIPCFNHGKYLDECVNSVLAQTYKNVDIVIVDDKSTDGVTKEIVKRQEEKNKKIFTIFNEENKGPAYSRNIGISYAKGRYILPLDADDKIHKDMLLKCFNIIEEKKDVFVYSYFQIFGNHHANGSVIRPSYSFKNMLNSNCAPYCGMYSKKCWEIVGGYNEKIGYEDWEFWIRMGKNGFHGIVIPEILFYYRRGVPTSRFDNDLIKKHKTLKKELETLHPELYSTSKNL